LKISIIVPSFNQSQFIEETLSSIISQKITDLEIIVIDGGSSDGTVEIIKAYDAKIKFWVSEPDNGQSHAINKGLEICTGDIVCWLNSDDLFMQNTLKEVNEIFESKPELDFILGETEMFNKDGIVSSNRLKNVELESQMLAGVATSQPSYFFKKSLLDRSGHLNEALHYGMDYDFFLRLTLNGQYKYFDKTWSRYRLHDDSKTETSQLKFATEWNNVFVSLLKSAKANKLLEQWSNYGFDISENYTYPTDRLNNDHLKEAMGFALYHQAVFQNQGLNVTRSVELLTLLKRDFNTVYRAMGVNDYYWKLRLKALLR
jgi:glycosyltransferase involved in cell wall biosynthesis